MSLAYHAVARKTIFGGRRQANFPSVFFADGAAAGLGLSGGESKALGVESWCGI
jgi:hypothetical protein